MEEYNIPVDYIGGSWRKLPLIYIANIFIGTSIGAFVGGLYARDVDLIASSGRVKQFSARMGNIWRMLSDLTWPVVAYTTVRLSFHCHNPTS